jgi:hypothetical protein
MAGTSNAAGQGSIGGPPDMTLTCGGRVCRAKTYDPIYVETVECTADGCPSNYAGCVQFDELIAGTTCDEICGSIGETCIARGCGDGTTWQSWALSQNCSSFPDQVGTSECDAQLQTSASKNCCCSDNDGMGAAGAGGQGGAAGSGGAGGAAGESAGGSGGEMAGGASGGGAGGSSGDAGEAGSAGAGGSN